MVQLLLDNGADPDAVDARNKTPLLCAMTESPRHRFQSSIVQVLIASDCDILNINDFREQWCELVNIPRVASLKQLTRSFLNNYKLQHSDLRKHLPNELIEYLTRKLISKN